MAEKRDHRNCKICFYIFLLILLLLCNVSATQHSLIPNCKSFYSAVHQIVTCLKKGVYLLVTRGAEIETKAQNSHIHIRDSDILPWQVLLYKNIWIISLSIIYEQ
jgi:hypothetical protein